MAGRRRREGMPLARMCMVVASLSPLFLLWAVRGIPSISDWVLIPTCIGLIIVPNLILLGRLFFAHRANDVQTKTVGAAEDHRDHLLVYLFAMLLPLWNASLGDTRNLAAALVALAFIIFLFWHLNLHYMNLAFALFNYHVYSIHPPKNAGIGGDEVFVLITKRTTLPEGTEISAYRISNHVFWEKGGD